MGKINPADSLQSTISLLELKREQELVGLKHQLRVTGQSLKPSNIIKSAVREVTSSPKLKTMLITTGAGIALSLIAKKLLERKQPIEKKQFLANVLQYGINFLASKRNSLVKAAGIYAANQIIEAVRARKRRRRHLKNGEPLRVTAES